MATGGAERWVVLRFYLWLESFSIVDCRLIPHCYGLWYLKRHHLWGSFLSCSNNNNNNPSVTPPTIIIQSRTKSQTHRIVNQLEEA
eukprot:scaffold1879_cov243-Chaetoceros_neogracile.AAC.4